MLKAVTTGIYFKNIKYEKCIKLVKFCTNNNGDESKNNKSSKKREDILKSNKTEANKLLEELEAILECNSTIGINDIQSTKNRMKGNRKTIFEKSKAERYALEEVQENNFKNKKYDLEKVLENNFKIKQEKTDFVPPKNLNEISSESKVQDIKYKSVNNLDKTESKKWQKEEKKTQYPLSGTKKEELDLKKPKTTQYLLSSTEGKDLDLNNPKTTNYPLSSTQGEDLGLNKSEENQYPLRGTKREDSDLKKSKYSIKDILEDNSKIEKTIQYPLSNTQGEDLDLNKPKYSIQEILKHNLKIKQQTDFVSSKNLKEISPAGKVGDVNQEVFDQKIRNNTNEINSKINQSRQSRARSFKNDDQQSSYKITNSFKISDSDIKQWSSDPQSKLMLDENNPISEYLRSILEINLVFEEQEMKKIQKSHLNDCELSVSKNSEEFLELIGSLQISDITKNFQDENNLVSESFINMKEPSMRLNIFRKYDLQKQDTDDTPSIMDIIESCEFRKMNTTIPNSNFHECIQWTRDKKMWNFPIDNEQDSEELQIGFHEHVFPQQYLTNKLPTTGIVGQFMNYVCMGLSQNPHLTVKEKKAHIKWYEDYLSNKLEEIDLAMKKSIEDQKYEEKLRNK